MSLKHTYGFPMMAEIIPPTPTPADDGPYIEHMTLTPEKVDHERNMAAWRGDWTCRYLEPGTYCVLKAKRGHTIYMSDTWMERFSNAEIREAARGDVLLAGLGIGMVPLACCRKVEVDSVTVLENDRRIMDLIAPYVAHPKLRLLEADANYPPVRGHRFDTIYLDIWSGICADNWDEMKPMLAQYRRFARNGAVVTGWLKDEVQRLAAEARREDRRWFH